MSGERRGRRRHREDGFTLVEVMVALGLLTVLLVASLPVLVGVLRTGVATMLETQGKNLAQERLEQIHDLRFHVDRQNGPFLDLLDLYYTHATAGRASTTLLVAGTALTGEYVATGGGLDGEPPAPYYRTSTGPLPGSPAFSQRVLTQFLAADGTSLPRSRFEGGYDSQVVGRDRPPGLLVAVTVITQWTADGTARTLSAYTRLTDGRPQEPLIQTQARGVAVEISSTGADGATLQLQGGVVSVDGAQSSGSSVSGYAAGARARRSGAADVTGSAGQFALPAQGPLVSGLAVPQSGPGCSWYGMGATSVADVTGDVSLGLPRAPADVDSGGLEPEVLSASVLRTGGGGCGQLSYDNTAGGGLPRTDLPSGPPFVQVADGAASGPGVRAAGYVTATALSAPVQQTSSGARASTADPVVLFPGYLPPQGQEPERGLVSVQLTAARLDCASGTGGTPGTVTGSYTLTLRWWGAASPLAAPTRQSATWQYDSSTASDPVLQPGSAVWDPASTYVAGRPLAELVSGDLAPGGVTEGATNGLRGFAEGVLTLTTAPTLSNEHAAGFSAVTVVLGRLTCVADDQR